MTESTQAPSARGLLSTDPLPSSLPPPPLSETRCTRVRSKAWIGEAGQPLATQRFFAGMRDLARRCTGCARTKFRYGARRSTSRRSDQRLLLSSARFARDQLLRECAQAAGSRSWSKPARRLLQRPGRWSITAISRAGASVINEQRQSIHLGLRPTSGGRPDAPARLPRTCRCSGRRASRQRISGLRR